MARVEDLLIRQIMRLPARAARNRTVGGDAFTAAILRPSRRAALALGLVAGMTVFDRARADGRDVSDWVMSDHARVRLVDAGTDGRNRIAGLQIELDPSFLTYWRTPGEAGVAPTVAFDGSGNLASASLAFPAPQRFDEGGAEAFGYKDAVVFPITAVPVDPQAPVALAVSLSFAVCSALCLPASANLRLDLRGQGGSPEAELVRDALRRVPTPLPVGAPGPLAVLSVESDPAHGRAQVLVRTPVGVQPVLFVETAEPWYVQAETGQALGDGRMRFECRILAGAKAPARIPAVLTLATDTTAIETAVHLDAAAPTP